MGSVSTSESRSYRNAQRITILLSSMSSNPDVHDWNVPQTPKGAKDVSRSAAVAIALTSPSARAAQDTSQSAEPSAFPSTAAPPPPKDGASGALNPVSRLVLMPSAPRGSPDPKVATRNPRVRGAAVAASVAPLHTLVRRAEPFFLLLLSALGGYLGTLARVGTSYLRPVKTWEVFPGSYLYP